MRCWMAYSTHTHTHKHTETKRRTQLHNTKTHGRCAFGTKKERNETTSLHSAHRFLGEREWRFPSLFHLLIVYGERRAEYGERKENEEVDGGRSVRRESFPLLFSSTHLSEKDELLFSAPHKNGRRGKEDEEGSFYQQQFWRAGEACNLSVISSRKTVVIICACSRCAVANWSRH